MTDNLLALNHFITLLSSLFITVDNSCKLLALQNNVVSSANKIETSAQDPEAISFMYSKNNNGPKIEPNQSRRSPKVVALFSATNFSSYIIKLLQLHDKI